MIKVGQILRHKRFIDVAFQVTSLHDRGNEVKVFVWWINWSSPRKYLICQGDFAINKKDLCQYYEVSLPSIP